MIALLLALNPVPALPAQDTEQMRVRPSTEADAVAEFEATCVPGLYDIEKLKRGASASRRGYSFTDAAPPNWRSWTSSYGSIHYLEAVPATSGVAPKCNMTSFTRATVNRKALDTALRAMAKRQSARGYAELRDNVGLSWSWYNAAGQPMTVEVSLDRRTPQQIILMLKPIAVSRPQ
ncbi:hypothetical protein OF829_17640 [Sphingomonas sp. LB-2]|uniref:hypothetical protein n=1 Tax=Sphingomonas caeni TaxID=2984949 RepID=UPI002232113A|nr:hypothetical protein [Sphingomonas caeni]MCW3849065.1 hypothetical protein [Sphingomonas caeni]